MKRTLRSRRWAPSIAAIAAFGALGATCAYWTLQLLAPPVAIAPAGSLVDTQTVPDLRSAQALFGSNASESPSAIPPPVDVRVVGVAASPVRGSAVLVVDSAAAKAFLVGDEIGDEMRLIEVRSDMAVLERRGVRIELPAPQRPSVALLSSGPQAADASAGTAALEPGMPRPAAAAAAPVASPPPPRDAAPSDAAGRHAASAGEAAVPDDPAIEAATLAPGGVPPAGAPRFSGIRASSGRSLATPANADAPAEGASN
ncbi:MAG: general secretion pathway protein GspB [Burkholderiaceae bacterium]|nr:general secretion pathway protein GspB [Burkholderiaceae bacterium]